MKRLDFRSTTELGTVRTLTDLRLAHEGCTFFDGKGACGNIADQHSIGLQFTTLLHSDIAFNLAKNGDRAGLDLTFDKSVFTHCKAAVRMDFSLNFTINDQIMGEFDGTFDFNIIGEDVFAG